MALIIVTLNCNVRENRQEVRGKRGKKGKEGKRFKIEFVRGSSLCS